MLWSRLQEQSCRRPHRQGVLNVHNMIMFVCVHVYTLYAPMITTHLIYPTTTTIVPNLYSLLSFAGREA